MQLNRILDPRIRFIAEPIEDGGPPPEDEGHEGEKPDEPLGEPGLKALQAERDARSQAEKQIADLNARLKEFEDAQKTDEERKQEALEERERALKDAADARAKAESKLLRYEVAAAKGIDVKLAGRLTGETREELEADAESLLDLIGATAPKTPKPDPSQGARGTKNASNAELFADALEGKL